jgi:hypothetical protein
VPSIQRNRRRHRSSQPHSGRRSRRAHAGRSAIRSRRSPGPL